MSQNIDRKVIWVNEQQTPVYLNAKAAVIREKGPDLSEGEVVEELAKAYTGTDGECSLPGYCGLVDETAAQNGDPVYTREELEAMGQHEIRQLAGEADTTEVTGKSTKLEIIAYFTCPYPGGETNGSTTSE